MARILAEIRLQRGLAARWTELNPILDDGEPAFEHDTGLIKIGDGVTEWTSLPYITTPEIPIGTELIGMGAPEGIVAADPGDHYTDIAGTNGAHTWLKKTGSGNTGWILTFGDTGWRNLDELLDEDSLDPTNAGFVQVRRVGELVHYRFSNLLLAAGYGFLAIWDTVPVGFRSVDLQVGFITSASNMNLQHRIAFIGSQMGWLSSEIFASGAVVSPGTRSDVGISGTTNFLTNDPWPSSLPGTPA